MCLILGFTWIPIKIGVNAVPPVFFAASRFFAAGGILIVVCLFLRQQVRIKCRHVWRLLVVAVFANVATYSLLFWGMVRVPTGLAAAESLGLIPIFLLTIAVLTGEEILSKRVVLAICLGLLGLLLLFRSDITSAVTNDVRFSGLLAIAVGTLCYAIGSVYSRALLRNYSPMAVSGWSFLAGGSLLFILAFLLEPISIASLEAFAHPAVMASWLFLVLFGSVIAFTVYLRLIRDLSPSKAGMYAFVSPVIAILAGIVFLGETVNPLDSAAMVLMLGGAWFALNAMSNEQTEFR